MTQLHESRKEAIKNGNTILANLCKLKMCSIYGKTVCKDVDISLNFVTEDKFTNRGIDSSIVDDWDILPNKLILLHTQTLPKGNFPSILGVYILAESRRIMNRMVEVIDGFNKLAVYYTDTDSLYISVDDVKKLNSLGYVGSELGLGKNETNPHTITKSIFLGPKLKCLQLSNGDIKISFKGLDDAIQKTKTMQDFEAYCERLDNIINNKENSDSETYTKERWKKTNSNGVLLYEITKIINGDKYTNKMVLEDELWKPLHHPIISL